MKIYTIIIIMFILLAQVQGASVVPVISGGGGDGGSPLLNLTEINQTNTTNVTLPVIKLPTLDKLMDIANSKEAILGMFIIFGVLSIVMLRGKKWLRRFK